jgi:hypothetical protein
MLTSFWLYSSSDMQVSPSSTELAPWVVSVSYKGPSRISSSWGYNSGYFPEIDMSTFLMALISPSAVNAVSWSSSSPEPFELVNRMNASPNF